MDGWVGLVRVRGFGGLWDGEERGGKYRRGGDGGFC